MTDCRSRDRLDCMDCIDGMNGIETAGRNGCMILRKVQKRLAGMAGKCTRPARARLCMALLHVCAAPGAYP